MTKCHVYINSLSKKSLDDVDDEIEKDSDEEMMMARF